MTARALFRADASPAMGGGHIMRCLVLADTLEARGWRCEFVTSTQSLDTVPHLARSGHKVAVLEPDCLSDPAAVTAGRKEGANLLVIDHYGLDAAFEAPLRSAVGMLLVIDDLANRHHDCDILVDQTFGRHADVYDGLVPMGCDLLTGSQHALLRAEFASQRAAALARRAGPAPVRRILVSLGITDPDNDTCIALDAIESAELNAAVDVVMGPGAPHLAAVQTRARAMAAEVTVHCDPKDIACLAVRADVAIGAGGSASWERCCLGLPTIVFSFGSVQAQVVDVLDRAGAITLVRPGPAPAAERLAAVLRTLAADAPGRLAMSQAAAAVCDGLGAGRVADAVEQRAAGRDA